MIRHGAVSVIVGITGGGAGGAGGAHVSASPMAMVYGMGPYYAALVRFAFITLGLVFAVACNRQRPGDLPPRPESFPTFLEGEGACAPARTERVACTLDGDTFDVGACGEEVGERIRMLGINAPEIAHDEPAECYGDIAATALRELIDGRSVVLTFDFECIDDPRYGRTLAYVYFEPDDAVVPDGDTGASASTYVLANEWMLQEGYARLAPEFWTTEDIRLLPELVAAEQRAREQGIGLWGACGDP